MPSSTRIGVDTGGTFTDLLCLDDRGLRVHKLRSVPAEPSQAILAGMEVLLEGAAVQGSLEVTHGSTVATNAVLERRGARAALVTTAGFEDVLRIGRQTRPELYNIFVTRPEPLIPPSLTFGLHERMGADGTVLEALDAAEVHALIPQLRALGVASVAICFLHSYAYPHHEAQAAAILRAAGFPVSTSHEILPEYREFERWSTTAVNAYVAPLMASYLTRLQSGLEQRAPGASLRIMQSNGGSISASRAATEAVQTILSGPAAGVVGALAVGRAAGFERLITFDMGGTSTDVSLLDGALGTTSESLVGDLPVRLPVLDIHTVGAGGGSIAYVDSGGAVRVGPKSAGAVPGPACFGSGTELTVTDANLLLGRLDPAFFLGGRMALDLERTQAIAGTLASRLGLSVPALAEGILHIANANMERAIRVVSVQRGHDPRDFALLAFGGAGGLHACELAASLEMNTVLVPEHAGVLSALGMLLADVAKDYSASILKPLQSLSVESLKSSLAPLLRSARADLAGERFSVENTVLEASLMLRYKGQAFELEVPLRPLDSEPDTIIQELAADFHLRHSQRYGYSNPARPVEAVQLRLRATGVTEKPDYTNASKLNSSPTTLQSPAEPLAVRESIFAGTPHATAVYRRTQLAPGHAAAGPALILSGEATTAIPPGWNWSIHPSGTLIALRPGVDHAR